MPDTNGYGEQFFRRYRELLDAEDSAFDELEHAYEDGDRAHFELDLAAWHGALERRHSTSNAAASPRRRTSRSPLTLADPRIRPSPPARRSPPARAATNAVACAITWSVRPTKKWLAPPTTCDCALRHCATSRRDLVGGAELVVLREHHVLRSRVVGHASRVSRAKRSGHAMSSHPAMSRRRARQRDVGAERPAREHERHAGREARREIGDRGERVEAFRVAARRTRHHCARRRGS